MKFFDSPGPIIACSSGSLTNVAISIIRISGVTKLDSINPFISIELDHISSRHCYYCQLYDEKHVFLDSIMLVFFQAPHSFNGENILELYVHGNVINVKNIIDMFVRNGVARHAEPGEFSYRALQNNKLSVAQVEGLDLLLNAGSDFILNQGKSILSGDLYILYKKLHKLYLNHKSSVELSIDFLEDVGEQSSNKNFNKTINQLDITISKLYKRAQNNTNLIKPSIVLLGSPNSGKSTFFNLVLDDERSIVSSTPGTTRDYIRETVSIRSICFDLIDTAGIRSAVDDIEKKGINKTYSLLENSFLNILLVNPFNVDRGFLSTLDTNSIDICLLTHADLPGFLAMANDFRRDYSFQTIVHASLQTGSIGAEIIFFDENVFGPIGPKNIMFDAPIGPVDIIFELTIMKFQKIIESRPITLDRHRDAINEIYLKFSEYKKLVNTVSDIAIISSELNSLGSSISELIGIISPDDVLENIFENFCIGK